MTRIVRARGNPEPKDNTPKESRNSVPSIFGQLRAQPGGGRPGGAATIPQSAADILSQAIGTPMVPNLPTKGDPLSLFRAAFDHANAANDTRYRQGLGLIAGQGQSSKDEAKRGAESGFAQDTQSLVSRGLGSSTVYDSSRRRRDEDYQRASQRIDESVADRAAGFIERRSDAAPDIGKLLELMQQKAQAESEAKAQKKGVTRSIFGPDMPGSGEGGGAGGGGAPVGMVPAGGGGGGGGRQGVQTYTNPRAGSVPMGWRGGPGLINAGPQPSFFNLPGRGVNTGKIQIKGRRRR